VAGSYAVVRCPKCGAAQITAARRWFRCRSCRYKTEMHRVRVWFRGSWEEAREYLYRLYGSAFRGWR